MSATTTEGYVLPHADHEPERERLALQSDVWRRPTEVVLDAAGVAPGARCLDVGCGGGDVMELLLERTGPAGRVVGLELDPGTAQATRERLPGTEVVVGDVLRADLPAGGFDVVTARHLLIHLTDPVAALRRMWEWTAPGGVLAVIEFDQRTATLAGEEPGVGAELRRVAHELFRRNGLDPRFGFRLPGCFEQAGIGTPETHVGGVLARTGRFVPMMEQTYRAMLPGALALGITTPGRAERFLASLRAEQEEDAADWMYAPFVVGAWARKPA